MTIKAPAIPARTGRTLKWERIKTARRIERNQSLIYRLAAPASRNRRMVPLAPLGREPLNGLLAGAYSFKTPGGPTARQLQEKSQIRRKNVTPRACVNCPALEIAGSMAFYLKKM